MILLPRGNRILGETVSSRINQVLGPDDKPEAMDVHLYDFDEVGYRVLIEPDSLNKLQLGLSCPWYGPIEKMGGKAALDRVYGSMVVEPMSNYNVTVQCSLDELKDQKTKDEMVTKLQCLKANILGGIFDYFFTSVLLEGNKTLQPFQFDLRSDTTVFFVPKADRVIVIFGIDFKEKVDKAVAKIMFQEFQEARRQAGLGASPPIAWSPQPPMELAHFKITEQSHPNILGYISFAVLKSHVEKDKKEKVIQVLQSFRNFMQYHIKCSKAYFHSRMRARVFDLIKVLNRAKYDSDGTKKEMKTAQGKTFVRK